MIGSQPPKPVKSFDREGLVMNCGSFSKSCSSTAARLQTDDHSNG